MKKEELENWKENVSEELLNEITALYDNRHNTLKSIVEKLDLPFSPSDIHQVVPDMKVEEECPYCVIKMYKKRSRTNRGHTETFCLKCSHKNIGYYVDVFSSMNNCSYDRYACHCQNCINQIVVLKNNCKELIKKVYAKPEVTKKYIELSLRERFYLLFLLIQQKPKRNGVEHITYKNIEGDEFFYEYINYLLDEQIVYISPTSSIEAFEGENFPHYYFFEKVVYDVNVKFTEEEIRSINKGKIDLKGIQVQEIRDFLGELIYKALIEEFKNNLSKREIGFNPTVKSKRDFIGLIDILSYTQLSYLCYSVAVFYNDRCSMGQMSRAAVSKCVMTSVKTFYEKRKEKGNEVPRSDVEYVDGQLRYFVEEVLERDIDILDEPIICFTFV